MIWDILLTATIETGLGILKEAGFGDSISEFRDKWLGTDQKKRQAALQDALGRAVKTSADPEIQDLLNHRPFQEEVIRALFDPMEGFNVQTMAEYWGEKFPEHVLALRKFFNALQNNLLNDPIWGPVLERYQSLRFRQDVIKTLEERKFPASDAALVRAVSQAAETYRAILKGDGAIAQGDHAKAVGAGGVLVEGSVEKIVQITIQQFITQGNTTAGNNHNGRRKYLELTANAANLLPWTKIIADQADPSRGDNLKLADVYIDLDTTEMQRMEREEELRQFLTKQREAERISAQEIVNRESKLLIMGDPGSGKSTFVKHLTYLMANAAKTGDTATWLKSLGDWKHGALLPVRIELRQVVEHAGSTAQGNARVILNYLHSELTSPGSGLESYWNEMSDAIQNEAGGMLFLLDGLDEVPAAQRQMVVDAVNELSNLYPNHRYVVTCRPYAYVGQPWKLIDFHEVTLAPFSDEQIGRFIENWYERLEERGRIKHNEVGEKTRSLKNAVRRHDLEELAERPLLLTVMTQLHAYAGKLPEDRVQLYDDTVNLLLQRWESRLGGDKDLLETLAIPGLKMSNLKSGLYEVAFNAHAMGTDTKGTADISEGQLREWLKDYLNKDWNKAGQFVDFIRERAGLLISYKPDAYVFPHRSFQEFLAACYLVGMKDYIGEAVKLVRADWDRWREVFILAASYESQNKHLHQAIAVVNALLPGDYKEGKNISPDQLRTCLLAGETLTEIGLMGVRQDEAGLAVLERTQSWLLAALQHDDLSPLERAEAGRVLSALGDPREEITTIEKMVFCRVPAGPFTMGENKESHQVDLPEFYISRFPISNAQFDQFVKAEGYKQQKYWMEAQQAGYWGAEGFKGRYDNEARNAPDDKGAPFNLSNHPVVGVSWYESLAFTRWLTDQLQVEGCKLQVYDSTTRSIYVDDNRKFEICLPSEAEWEKAARGTDGRKYPWGEEFNSNFANVSETGIGTTTALGCFLTGISPYGLLETSGNVWEWTRSNSDGKDDFQSKDSRLLRGGSFFNDSDYARCAYRGRGYPGYMYRYWGFRVVVSPVLPS